VECFFGYVDLLVIYSIVEAILYAQSILDGVQLSLFVLQATLKVLRDFEFSLSRFRLQETEWVYLTDHLFLKSHSHEGPLFLFYESLDSEQQKVGF
jgi:hypothetical protein